MVEVGLVGLRRQLVPRAPRRMRFVTGGAGRGGGLGRPPRRAGAPPGEPPARVPRVSRIVAEQGALRWRRHFGLAVIATNMHAHGRRSRVLHALRTCVEGTRDPINTDIHHCGARRRAKSRGALTVMICVSFRAFASKPERSFDGISADDGTLLASGSVTSGGGADPGRRTGGEAVCGGRRQVGGRGQRRGMRGANDLNQ